MADQTTNPVYFDIFRALHRGGLSLWLNRRAFFPMTLIPTIVTFFTIMIIRGIGEDSASAFALALLKIPSDFVTGLLSAVVIYIILNAPRKGDNDKPAIFVLNITERKDLLISAAILHVIIAYFASGLFAGSEYIMGPIHQAIENNTDPEISAGVILPLILIFIIFLYGIRFLMAPIVMMGNHNIISFFKSYASFGISFPIIMVKVLTVLSTGFVVMFLISILQAFNQSSGADASPIVMGFIDFFVSWFSVFSTVWFYAAMTIGFRQMTERKGS